jgi:uroporphyrinogen-III decarboxylase
LKGSCQTKYLITQEEELDILEYYLDSLLEVKDFTKITEHIMHIRSILGEENALDIQWAMQPYELLCFPSTMDTAILAIDAPDQFRRLMDKILRLDEILIKAVAKGGADFVFLGGPGSEMISPKYYEDFLVPYSKQVTDMAHQNGLLVYTHICSPIEPMLTLGYYNQMGIDLFETLSEEPVGNVKSIEDAFSKLSHDICTRGNIGLDKLLQSTPEQIKEHSFRILETARKMGRKHILAASDYMFYDTPVENVHSMCEAVREFNK